MSEHVDQQQDIAPYVSGRLDEIGRLELERHLADCQECRDLVAWCEGVAAGSHPEPLTLKRFTEGAKAPEGRAIAAHLEKCMSCALEVERWRHGSAAEASGRFVRSRWDLRSGIAGAALAAACVLGMALLWPNRPAPASPAGGVAEWIVLEPPTRGAVEVRQVRPIPGQQLLPVGVSLNLPANIADADGLRLDIVDETGRVLWGQDISAGGARSAMRANGILLVQVPLADLSGGRHVLRLAPRDERVGSPLVEIPFDIRP